MHPTSFPHRCRMTPNPVAKSFYALLGETDNGKCTPATLPQSTPPSLEARSGPVRVVGGALKESVRSEGGPRPGPLRILLAPTRRVGALLVHVGVGREHQLLGEVGLVVADPLLFPVLDVLLLVADGLVRGVELGGDAVADGACRAAGRDEEGDEELPL